MTDCLKIHKYYMKKATLQSKDIYNSGNDYDQSILTQPQPVDEYVTDSDVVFVTGGNSFSLTKICSALSSQYNITV